MTGSQSNFEEVSEQIREAERRAGRAENSVRLMAVTKTVPAERVNDAIRYGITLLGENRVQEYLQKKELYLPGAEIHFIGTLQKNKVKYLTDTVSMIESVNSLSLAEEIDRQAEKQGKTMNILLEVNIGEEHSKTGIGKEDLYGLLEKLPNLSSLRTEGLMCIPPVCDSESDLRRYFKEMHKLFIDIGTKKLDNINMNVLSMGMSSDFGIAIEEGATQVRVGTRLFGVR